MVIRIRDYGPGIPDDELPLVKKKFFKGSPRPEAPASAWQFAMRL